MPMTGRLAEFCGGQLGEVLRPPGIGEHCAAVLYEAGLSAQEAQAQIVSDILRTGPPMVRRFGLTYR